MIHAHRAADEYPFPVRQMAHFPVALAFTAVLTHDDLSNFYPTGQILACFDRVRSQGRCSLLPYSAAKNLGLK
jgi:hypothetical protein